MFPDGTEFYLDTKEGERGYNSDPARGADTFVPFSNSKMDTKYTYIENQFVTKSDSVVCMHGGYAYIFVNVFANGVTRAPYTISHNDILIYNESAAKGCYMHAIKVKKGDKISWDITCIGNVYGIDLCIVYPS